MTIEIIREGRFRQDVWGRYYDYAMGRCFCGRNIILRDWTNTCECGHEFNCSGELLEPRGGR